MSMTTEEKRDRIRNAHGAPDWKAIATALHDALGWESRHESAEVKAARDAYRAALKTTA